MKCARSLLARSHICYLALRWLTCTDIATWHSETLHKLASRTIVRPLSHAGGGASTHLVRVRAVGLRALLTVCGLAALSHSGCFSALRLHVSHFEGPSQDLAPAVNAVYVCLTCVNVE